MREHVRQKLYVENRPSVVINVSRQSGKSWGMVCEAFEYALTHAGAVVWYLAPFGNQIDKIVRLSIERILAFFPADMMPVKRGKTWRFKNGSVFDLHGVNVGKGARIRGSPASLVVIDECRDIAHLKGIIESSINPMFITTAGKLVLISTPPDTPLHPFACEYIAKAIYNGTYLHATYKDNPMLLQTDDDLRLMYPLMERDPVFRREYLADYTIADVSRKIIKNWDATGNDEWMAEYTKDKPHMYDAYCGMDPGFSTDALGLVFGYFDWRTGVLVIEAEYSEHQMTTEMVADTINNMETDLGYRDRSRCVRTHRISDIAKRMIADLQMQYGLDFEPIDKRGLTKAAMIALLEDELGTRIRVSENCPRLRQQIAAGIWNERGNDYERTESMSHLDLLDGLRYLAMSCGWHRSYKNVDVLNTYDVRSSTIQNPFLNRAKGRPSWIDSLRKA